VTIDPELQTEIDATIAARRAAGASVDPHEISIELTRKWEEPVGRGSGNWLYQMRESVRKRIEVMLTEQA